MGWPSFLPCLLSLTPTVFPIVSLMIAMRQQTAPVIKKSTINVVA